MTEQEKGRPGKGGPSRRSENLRESRSRRPVPSRSIPERPVGVKVYAGGGQLCAPNWQPGNPTGKGRGERGEIVGWSLASRRRMRQWLVTHQPPEGWHQFAVTVTIPGPVMAVPEWRALWDRWRKRIERQEWAAVWRIEIQERGQVHWHLWVTAPPHVVESVTVGQYICGPDWTSGQLRQMWLDCLDGCEAVHYTKKDGSPCAGRLPTGEWVTWGSRSWWPGAERHAVDVNYGEGEQVRGGWLRYLQDHASKGKQEQIPENVGRHWGVIGKNLWREVVPDFVPLPGRAWWRFIRAYERLVSGTEYCPSAVFGRRVRRGIKRGRFGRTVTFTRPDTLLRLSRWASAF